MIRAINVNHFTAVLRLQHQFVDGMQKIAKSAAGFYYHSGLDIGGSEGLVEVVAAIDRLVVSVGEVVLKEHKRDTPVAPRYDVVYLLDGRG